MPVAWVLGAANEQEHTEFCQAFKETFEGHPEVKLIEHVPHLPKKQKEFRALQKEWQAMYDPNVDTLLVAQWPNDFDDDGVRIGELLDYNSNIVYILDDRPEWEDVLLCMKRRAGQSIKDFVADLR